MVTGMGLLKGLNNDHDQYRYDNDQRTFVEDAKE